MSSLVFEALEVAAMDQLPLVMRLKGVLELLDPPPQEFKSRQTIKDTADAIRNFNVRLRSAACGGFVAEGVKSD